MATKTYELKVRFTIKEDENDEWFEFKNDILNGAFQRSMMDDNKIGMNKITATITEIKK
jgi:ketol-acid reductoisomerase